MWHIVLADWRRTLLIQSLSWATLAIILALVARDFRTGCCAQEDWRLLRDSKFLFLCLLYAQMSLVWWVQSNGPVASQRIVDPLPLSVRELNLTRLAHGGVFFALGALAWIPVIAVWNHFDRPLSGWMVPLSGVTAVCFLLWGMRNRFPRTVVPFLIPFLIVPSTETLVARPLEWAASPWPTLSMTALAIVYGRWVIRRPPPRWAQMAGK